MKCVPKICLWDAVSFVLRFIVLLAKIMKFIGGALSAVRAQCTRSATIWVFGRTGDPCFEIIGASLLPCCVGFDAFSTLGI